MNLSDYYIHKRIQGGDIREFEKVFKQYHKALCLYAFGILKDMDVAEDIVQEFFYHYWKNRQQTNIQVSLKSYFYESIRKNSLHYLEHLEVRRQYSDYQQNNQVSEAEDVTGPGLDELQYIIETTLKLLPERCAAIFRMSRFEGRKYKEIAEQMMISVKTVEAEMGKALQKFRETLLEYRSVSVKN